MLRAQPNEQQILFRVGVADVVPKSIVYRLIAPTMELSEPIRITCREDKLERLLADLAIQRLDLVISDSPMPTHLDIKGYSQKLGECGISFFATQALADAYGGDFPTVLAGRAAVDSGCGDRGAQPFAALVCRAADPTEDHRRVRRQRLDAGLRPIRQRDFHRPQRDRR